MAKLGIFGLGALGAAQLATALDHDPGSDIAVVAGGARAERLRRDGIVANGKHYPVRIAEPGEPVEVIVVAVKTTTLEASLPDLAPFVGPGTALLSLLNGVSSERTLRASFPDAYVPATYSVTSNAGRDEQGFRFFCPGIDVFGEPGGAVTPRLEHIAEILADYGIPHQISPDIEVGQWQKFVLNVGINQASALLKANYRPFQQPGTQARELMLDLQREALAVAQAHGIALTEAHHREIITIIDALDPAGYTSMAQDAIAALPMETDAFGGEVLRLGQEHHIPTPVNEVVVQALQAMEEVSATR